MGGYYLCKFSPFFPKKLQKECHGQKAAILTYEIGPETLVNQGGKKIEKIIKKC